METQHKAVQQMCQIRWETGGRVEQGGSGEGTVEREESTKRLTSIAHTHTHISRQAKHTRKSRQAHRHPDYQPSFPQHHYTHSPWLYQYAPYISPERLGSISVCTCVCVCVCVRVCVCMCGGVQLSRIMKPLLYGGHRHVLYI